MSQEEILQVCNDSYGPGNPKGSVFEVCGTGTYPNPKTHIRVNLSSIEPLEELYLEDQSQPRYVPNSNGSVKLING
jgi:hypothetical protein